MRYTLTLYLIIVTFYLRTFTFCFIIMIFIKYFCLFLISEVWFSLLLESAFENNINVALKKKSFWSFYWSTLVEVRLFCHTNEIHFTLACPRQLKSRVSNSSVWNASKAVFHLKVPRTFIPRSCLSRNQNAPSACCFLCFHSCLKTSEYLADYSAHRFFYTSSVRATVQQISSSVNVSYAVFCRMMIKKEIFKVY